MTTTTVPQPEAAPTASDRATAAAAARRKRQRASRPAWEEPPTVATSSVKGVSIALFLALILVPIYSVVLTSFSDQRTVTKAGGLVVVPHGLTLQAYEDILGGGVVTRALVISLGITLVGTVLSLVVTVLAAFGLARSGSFGHRTILMTLVITMFFSGGLIPTFLVVTKLGGYEQYWSLILPSAVSVFNIIIMRGFFAATAQELIDSARVDGAGDWRILWSIVLPISKPVTVVIALFYGVGYWNSFFNVLLYMPTATQKWPLQMVLYSYVTQGRQMAGLGANAQGSSILHQQVTPLSLQMAVVVLTLIPIVVVYPFVQKHFAKGMLIGAVKG